jgi:hypothetical protein
MMSILRLPGSVLLLVVFVLGPAWAGPHAGGILVAHNPALWESATDGAVSICDQGSAPSGYGGIWARVNGATASNPAIWKVYCVFPSAASPRLAGLTFGLSYDEDKISLPRWGNCAGFELPDPAWPASGTGNSLLWDTPATGTIVQAYWFTGYADSPATADLGPNPTQGGTFADDGNPAELDPIAGYGEMGFDMDGAVPPLGGGPGACCDRQSGVCSLATAEGCGANIFKGSGTACTPDPCTTFGACCDPINFLCLQASRAECDARSGAFLGVETTCAVEGDALCFIAGACCTACGCGITLQGDCPPP